MTRVGGGSSNRSHLLHSGHQSVRSISTAAAMFANTVNHRTRTITSRPVSRLLPTPIPEYVSTMRPSSYCSSFTSSNRTSLMQHQNDSEATLINDILVLQIAKESKDYDADPATPLEDQHPLLRSMSAPVSPIARSNPSKHNNHVRHSRAWSHSSTESADSVLSNTSRDGPKDRYSTRLLVERRSSR